MAADQEIKELVTKTLEAQGVLGQIKAQLRAAVFKAINHDKTTQHNGLRQALFATTSSKLALGIVVEFLEHFKLHQTLSVLTSEASFVETEIKSSRKELMAALNLSSASPSNALLAELVNAPREEALKAQDKPFEKNVEKASIFNLEEREVETTESKPIADTKKFAPIQVVSEEPLKKELPKDMKQEKSAAALPPIDTHDDGELVEAEDAVEVDESMEEYSMDSAPPSPIKQAEPVLKKEEPKELRAEEPKKTTSIVQDDESDKEESQADEEDNEAARLAALDAKLKAMEAEDATGTLKSLKASLQTELDAKSDDDHYGSDFEEDFEEDIASDVEEGSEHEDEESLPSFKPSASDRVVSSGAALDAYDYVEKVIRP